MKNSLIFFLLVICSVQLFSQRDKTLFGKGLDMSASWAGISFTSSKIMDKTVNQLGLDVGFEYNGNLLTGYQWRSTIDEVVLAGLTDNNQLKYNYHTFLVGYTLPTHRMIHPRFTIGVGPGNIQLDNVKDQIFVVQPEVGVEINLLQWMRLSLNGGYRKVSGIQSASLTNDNFTNFYGSASLRFGWSWGN